MEWGKLPLENEGHYLKTKEYPTFGASTAVLWFEWLHLSEKVVESPTSLGFFWVETALCLCAHVNYLQMLQFSLTD